MEREKERNNEEMEMEPNTWRTQRPLGAWCGHKRPDETQGGNKSQRLWSTGERGEEEKRKHQWTKSWKRSDSDMDCHVCGDMVCYGVCTRVVGVKPGEIVLGPCSTSASSAWSSSIEKSMRAALATGKCHQGSSAWSAWMSCSLGYGCGVGHYR